MITSTLYTLYTILLINTFLLKVHSYSIHCIPVNKQTQKRGPERATHPSPWQHGDMTEQTPSADEDMVESSRKKVSGPWAGTPVNVDILCFINL